MDEAGRFTAEHTVMEAGMEIRELKHLLKVAEDRIEKLEKEVAKLKSAHNHGTRVRNDESEGITLHFDDEPLHSVASEKHNDFGITFSDKSQLNADDEEPNDNSY